MDTYSITINNDAEGHTYQAYQIFTGDLNEGVLSNIKWGASVTNAEYLDNAAATARRLDVDYTGEDKLTLDELLDMIALGQPVADSGETCDPYVISGLAAGYYLVKDKNGSLTGEDDAYTEYIIKTLGDVTTDPKSDVPEVEKKVKDTNDSTGESSDWQDSADYDVGDSIPFQLKATLADNVTAYTTYSVAFYDTLSKGLTYNGDAKVCIDGREVAPNGELGFTITSAVNADGTTSLTVSFENIKLMGGTNSSVVTVDYTATLNDAAVVGAEGNPNKVYLEFSNNPNWECVNETGNTPEDVVIVFTYKVIINKVDGEGRPLTGAEFTLEKYNQETDAWVTVDVATNEEGTTFTFAGLDDGDYRLTETRTPAGYNTIEPIEFTITAEHEIISDNPALISLNGETATGELIFTPNLPEGSLTGDVVNQAGSILPETGGMGTTIFYALGGILVLAAVVLLITRKRMSMKS